MKIGARGSMMECWKQPVLIPNHRALTVIRLPWHQKAGNGIGEQGMLTLNSEGLLVDTH